MACLHRAIDLRFVKLTRLGNAAHFCACGELVVVLRDTGALAVSGLASHASKSRGSDSPPSTTPLPGVRAND